MSSFGESSIESNVSEEGVEGSIESTAIIDEIISNAKKAGYKCGVTAATCIMENTAKLNEMGLTFDDFRVIGPTYSYVSVMQIRKHLDAEREKAGLATEAFLHDASHALTVTETAVTKPVQPVLKKQESQQSEQFDASQESMESEEAYVEGAKGKSAHEMDSKELTELIAEKDAIKDVSTSHSH
jgi:hypothetical protein